MIITQNSLREFEHHLYLEEKEPGTSSTYLTTVGQFARWCGRQTISKELVLEYKGYLIDRYSPGTVNSKIGPINIFLKFLQHPEMCVKRLRIQRQIYYPEEKTLSLNEYLRLVETAERQGNYRISLAMQILCSTGIRVGELAYITVESARRGRAVVKNKGKTRIIFLPEALSGKILLYAKSYHITSGPVILTSTGRPIDRTNMWRYMNRLCGDAGIDPEKGHPHALRHLFAVIHYRSYKDPIGLADLLGHANINTTRIYTATDGKAQIEQLNGMNLVP